ncbi:sulfite exporter TauE/SafE family protein [Brucella thiophenivorans]|uniref:Sulfite exporter TauE/SafE family protein n=1 Tax=Brucella thiophenivorans TaxID=571255 RepID=A0A256FXA7_9HYPH|nr:sulfite exporter TauE/SafE family protein [Brucella thiophenivorans]
MAGSLAGAWFGAGWATRLKSETLYKVISVLLVTIAVVLVIGHDASAGQPLLTGVAQRTAGVIAGFIIGIVASLLGVAGESCSSRRWFCFLARISNWQVLVPWL